uniref:AlNc14C29G2775 protein n=1 Tax=Albugo laibachii Nc14 TaxID=890382 RepID=F0W7G1_9STRA|nr:AlNc14C29G2775 [Albugo laibachii Nc14]|eukprot:CCA17062.1 AlNc14C29G2775 [Albugo laibachii Nc14]
MKTFLLFLASAVGASFVSAQSGMKPESTMREDFPSEENEEYDPEQSRYGRHHGGWDGRRGGWDGHRGGRRGGW